jgi:hypothetical protein
MVRRAAGAVPKEKQRRELSRRVEPETWTLKAEEIVGMVEDLR